MNYFRHQSWAWQKEDKAILYFDFSPKKKSYQLRGEFRRIKDPARQNLKIFMNQIELSYKWISNDMFEAEMDGETLLSGMNEIAFHVSEFRPLSVRLSWFEVLPVLKEK